MKIFLKFVLKISENSDHPCDTPKNKTQQEADQEASIAIKISIDL